MPYIPTAVQAVRIVAAYLRIRSGIAMVDATRSLFPSVGCGELAARLYECVGGGAGSQSAPCT